MKRLLNTQPERLARGRLPTLVSRCSARWFSPSSSTPIRPPLISITNASFYRDYPAPGLVNDSNAPIFSNISFNLPSGAQSPAELQHWAVVGSSGKAKFLGVLNGQYICIPPTARSYPYLATEEIKEKDPRLRVPAFAVKYVGFDGDAKRAAGGVRGAYLSARYESRREDTDFTLLQYLTGHTELNAIIEENPVNLRVLERVVVDLKLETLLDMPVANLSNGQTRRARIAKALLDEPEVLLLDEPFMGLDPPTVERLSKMLQNLAVKSAPRLIITLRPQDFVPSWITHLVILGAANTVALQGEKSTVLRKLDIWSAVSRRAIVPASDANKGVAGHNIPKLLPWSMQDNQFYQALSREERVEYDDIEKLCENNLFGSRQDILNGFGIASKVSNESSVFRKYVPCGEAIIEMDGVTVQYGDNVVLGGWEQRIGTEKKPGLHWKVCRGQRWGVFGLNGSGKTTLLSLITSDHPQAYALPIKLFGRSRLPEPGKRGISVFDLQRRIGHSSPEVHAFFPRHLSVRASIETAWSDTFLAKPKLDSENKLDVDSALRFFEADLNPKFVHWSERPPIDQLKWATSIPFSQLSIAQQRLVLFIRALVHSPDLIVLDEPFAGMSASLRDKCLHFLEVGEMNITSSGSRRMGGLEAWNLPPDTPEHKPRHTGIGDQQGLIVISHVKEEVPDIISHWMVLPSPIQQQKSGDLELRTGIVGDNSAISSEEVWQEIWETSKE